LSKYEAINEGNPIGDKRNASQDVILIFVFGEAVGKSKNDTSQKWQFQRLHLHPSSLPLLRLSLPVKHKRHIIHVSVVIC
jgi:hypothetical protein